MKIRAVIDRMTRMNQTAWDFYIRSLQLSCVLLLGACALLASFGASGPYRLYIQAQALAECAQVAMLMGAIIPVCLEDLLGSGR